jgi:hypothetical protein
LLPTGDGERLPGVTSVGSDEVRAASARNEARLRHARERLYAEGLALKESARRVGVTTD